ncbi:hypothetical protein [Dyadobacter sandarakinus]|uniref:Uncharacterized protein n=1 Tax=Dyadobacter sandarakinus TaxID=2747268 RepID=A0ABX7IAR0_9BACT|nr:hypothetical protein [Dyadobacter sandarakinus]QRR02903.1 hypothetical protein HWI92_19305 [Dyadobacter sandarakinus]
MKAFYQGIRLFYSSFAPFSIGLSFLFWLVAEMPLGIDLLRFLPLFIFFKAFSGGLIWYYITTFEAGQLYFYYNMGLSQRRLFTAAFATDVLIFGIFVITASLFF